MGKIQAAATAAFRHAVRLLTCLPLAATAACASIVSDNESTTYVNTEPEGARCELHGQDFTRAIVTPGSITLPSDAAPITLDCSAESYRTTTATLDTSADGWMVGNVIFGLLGGPIGLAVDAARGAGMKYPPQLTVVLEPESFASADDRDRWYDNHRKGLEEKWQAVIDEIERRCERGFNELCDSKVKKARDARGGEIKALEARRLTAAVI